MMSFGQIVYIPDANFKACLLDNTNLNTNGDDEIQLSEAIVFDGNILCESMNISDVTGVEAFTSLTYFNIAYNQLFDIDVTQNIQLEKLYCQGNYLSEIDVSQNIYLTHLNCRYNFQIAQLDLSQNINLRFLQCQMNNILNLDLSQNIALEDVICDVNQISYLDLSNCPNLFRLSCSENNLICLNVANGNNVNLNVFSAEDNPDLNCVEVDNPAWSNQYMGNIPDGAIFSTQCNYPSSCFSASLNELTTSKNLIQILDMMGRETSFKPNTPLLYIYNDGTVERKMIIKP